MARVYTAVDPILDFFLITNISANNECQTRRQAISTVSTEALTSRPCQRDRLLSLLILCHYSEWIHLFATIYSTKIKI